MLFSSSGSVTSGVKSNWLVKEHVHRIYIENILCVCQYAAEPKWILSVSVSLYEFVIQENALAKSEAFYILHLFCFLKCTSHLNNALVLKSSSRLICAGNFGLLCSSVEREADNAQIACDCWPFGYFLLSYVHNRPANQSRWLSWPSWVAWWCTVTLCMIERMNLSHLIKTRINNEDDWLFTDFN